MLQFAGFVFSFISLSASAPATCVVVDGDRILAKDLASGVVAFTAMDPNVEIGYSPRPGATRFMRAGELRMLARRYGITPKAPFEDTCFTRSQSERTQTSAAPDVRRGDTVAVEVRSGGARLKFASRAESGGRAGESVMVRNPVNGRIFRAVVEEKGKVVVRK